MRIEIDKVVLNKYNFNFEKNIKFLLKFIPDDHIIKLDKIKIVECEGRKTGKHSGYYLGESEGHAPTIVICANNLFQGYPRFFSYVSLFPRLFLAGTLYHEIGHHYQRLQHGIKKELWERNAEKYAKAMEREVFLSSGLFKVLKLFKFILVPILKFYKKQKGQ